MAKQKARVPNQQTAGYGRTVMPVKPPGVRWGKVRELNRSVHVGTPRFKTYYPVRLRHLSSWRRAHALGSHRSVSTWARYRGVSPSSDMPLKLKLEYCRWKDAKTKGAAG